MIKTTETLQAVNDRRNTALGKNTTEGDMNDENTGDQYQ
jgi:hypothetical protein